MKKRCAKEALGFIKNHTIIGLGGGETIAHLISFIKESGLDVKIVTPSDKTEMLCKEHGLEIVPTWLVNEVDVAFDGCDEVDHNLNALKSGGAIHTKEKIIASMAKQYILLVDESKVSKVLQFKVPIVLEICKDSKSYVEQKIKQFGGMPSMRMSHAKDGFTISDSGNYIMDVEFSKVDSIKELNDNLLGITGVVDTSLFYQIATKVLVVTESGIHTISGGNS